MGSWGNEIEIDPVRPARTMAEMTKVELGVDVDPEAMVRLFKKRWMFLSRLAHEIHHANVASESTGNRG